MIKLVAFDWNGTLFADTKAVLESVNEVQKAFSLEVLTLKRFRDTTQVPISEFYSANGMDFETLANPHQISSLKIKKYFSTLLANPKRDFAIRKRTKRKRLERYAKEKGISFAEILVVGDALEEIEIAKEIGTLSVAITDGHCSTKRLKAAKPDYLISDLGNLIFVFGFFIFISTISDFNPSTT